MSDYRSHLSVALWATLMALALGAVLTLPERVVSFEVLGSPISASLNAELLVALVAVAIVCAGLEAAIRTHPQPGLLKHTYRYWALPGAIVLTAAAILPAAPTNALWFAVLALTGLALAAVTVAEYHTIAPGEPHYRSARLTLNILAYATAAVVFILIYTTRSRSLISATAIGVISGLLTLELLRSVQYRFRQALLYSVVIALVMAQSTWVFNYWPFASARMGLILLVQFYLLVGLAHQELLGQLTRRRGLEYLILAGVAVALMVWFPTL
ncbi:MAG TPA: hypothetical protein G4N94_00940 [Caldilineae bacterium]|nr:hypothetical protein [Caldilineae bacterium]